MKTFKEFVSEAAQVQMGPKGAGSWIRNDDKESEVIDHPTEKTVGNEPFKDTLYFRQQKKKYINKMRKVIAKKKTQLPPVLGTEHPADSSVQSIVDGNHRRRAAVNARAPSLSVEKVPHENIRLLHPDKMSDTQPNKRAGVRLSALRRKDGSYDMDKPRKKLGGLSIRHYFVNPDGSHNFESPK